MSEESATATETTQTQDASQTQDPTAVVDKAEESGSQQTETTTEETKTEETAGKGQELKSALAEGDTEAAAEDEGPPESYEWNVPKQLAEQMPEGWQLNASVMDKLGEVSRKLGLSQDKAQSLVDEVFPEMRRQALAEDHALNEQWLKESQADPEIGGEGYKKNMAQVQRGLHAYGSDGLVAMLKSHPIGSHPEMLRMFFRVGATVSEDEFVDGKRASKTVDLNDRDAVAESWYGE